MTGERRRFDPRSEKGGGAFRKDRVSVHEPDARESLLTLDGSSANRRPAAELGLCRPASIASFDRADVPDPFNTAPAHGFETKEGKRYDDNGSEEWRDGAEADY